MQSHDSQLTETPSNEESVSPEGIQNLPIELETACETEQASSTQMIVDRM